jgi:hypothetical protein
MTVCVVSLTCDVGQVVASAQNACTLEVSQCHARKRHLILVCLEPNLICNHHNPDVSVFCNVKEQKELFTTKTVELVALYVAVVRVVNVRLKAKTTTKHTQCRTVWSVRGCIHTRSDPSLRS